jgi:hypothetical protein
MIDRPSRDKLAEALRQYVSGRITNDTLDDIKVDERDNGAVAVKEAAWYLYDDLHEHKAVDGFYIDKKDRKEIARWIVFLQSDEEYIWPKMSILDFILSMLTFGLYRKIQLNRWKKIGDLSVWPFGSENELRKATAKPKLFAGKAHNKSAERKE